MTRERGNISLLPRCLLGAGRYPASRLVWCLWLRKRLRKELRQSLQDSCLGGRHALALLWWGSACVARGQGQHLPGVALWRQGLGSVFVQCGHLGCGCNSWSIQEEVCLQIIGLPLGGLFTFFSVAVTFIGGTLFEVCLSCSLFTLVSLLYSIFLLTLICATSCIKLRSSFQPKTKSFIQLHCGQQARWSHVILETQR